MVQSPFAANAKISVASYPFNHVIIENAFSERLYQAILAAFQSQIMRGGPIGKVGETGDLIYNAIAYTPTLSELRQTAIGTMLAPEIKSWFCRILDIQLNEYLMLGLHRHEPPSVGGWTHTDCSIVSFPTSEQRPGYYNIFQVDSGVQYADDSQDRQPTSVKTARAIACLYYLANPNWRPGDGGETGLFLQDGKTLAATIPPVNNTLFAFEISPISYHAYLGSPAAQRNSIIWWYHADIKYLMDRHASHFEFKQRLHRDPWDRWTAADVAKYTSDAPTVNA